MIIYKFTNKVNGKVYIGQTIHTLDKRVKNHLKESKQDTNRPILNAIKKYGIEQFDIEVIDCASTQEELDTKEIEWIKKLDCVSPNGYNVLGGGQFNKTSTEEFSKSISEGLKNSKKWNQIKNSEEYKNKMQVRFIGYNKGKKFSDNHKNKIWESNKERILQYNKSTAIKWIIVEEDNTIIRLEGKEEYCEKYDICPGNLTRQSKKLDNGDNVKRYYGRYCFMDKGESDEQILSIVKKFDDDYNTIFHFYNSGNNQIMKIKKGEFSQFCKSNNLDVSNLLKVHKGLLKSYRGWITYSKPNTTSISEKF